jgi:hypothetical protein
MLPKGYSGMKYFDQKVLESSFDYLCFLQIIFHKNVLGNISGYFEDEEIDQFGM